MFHNFKLYKQSKGQNILNVWKPGYVKTPHNGTIIYLLEFSTHQVHYYHFHETLRSNSNF